MRADGLVTLACNGGRADRSGDARALGAAHALRRVVVSRRTDGVSLERLRRDGRRRAWRPIARAACGARAGRGRAADRASPGPRVALPAAGIPYTRARRAADPR